MADVSDSTISYLDGAYTGTSVVGGYLSGGGATTENIPVYLSGDIFSIDQIPGFLYGDDEFISSRFAYLYGIVRGDLGGYLKGSVTGDDDVANDYITLRSSDSSIDKKFRVLATDYDDGTPEKAGTVKRTLGGGIAHSVGGIYYSWAPTIRVRHTEGEPGYGDLQDLIDLYELNNPVGTPSNVITFIDHHNVSHLVLMPGALNKAVLGTEIEGAEAHSIVRITLQEIPNA